MKIELNTNCSVGEHSKPYIIAELGSNHNGDMELAKRLIDAACNAGADCVKFQSWTKGTIFSRKTYDDNYFLNDDYRNRDDYTLEEIVDKYAITENQLLEMKQYADSAGIACTSTPFSKSEVDFLVDELKTDFIKVASMDLNNYPLLSYIAKKNKPVFLSTGLSTLSEIDRAIQTIEQAGNKQIVILHCVSIYPPDDSQVNLKNMHTLKSAFAYPVGFSDHSLGTAISLAAIAMEACVIEKHFTLDKDLEGWDHKISMSPEELEHLIMEGRRIHEALGSGVVQLQEDSDRLDAFRRSVVASSDIKQGQVITESMLDSKRPGSGLPPEFIEKITGYRAKRNIAADEIIMLDDLQG